MRLTIISYDSHVYIDGEAMIVDLSDLDPTIHAVQWNGSKGEIEWRPYDDEGNKKYNTRFDDLSQFQVYIDRWAEAKNKADALKVEQIAHRSNTEKPVNVIAD